ncbi:MAG TPA: aminotransferase DegT [Gammaproteobacteria bacterium]|nr:aminotransferase DegT [Gammaproteobacteria bacterium]
MTVRIGRTLPPAAAPIPLSTVLRALPSCFRPENAEFLLEKEIKQKFGQPYCFLVSSGKAALTLILKALHKLYPDRDEVLIPAFTCYSVPAAIKRAGLQVKLCDTGSHSLDFDKEQLKKLIQADKKEKKILCVLVTHLFGCPADFTAIKQIVGEDIPLVEDAAQAMGTEINGRKIGSLGDVGFFSLGRGKALSTIEGGVIISKRPDLGTELNSLIKDLEIYTFSNKIKLVVKAIITTLLQHPVLFWFPKALPFLRLGETLYEDDFPLRRLSPVQRGLAKNWPIRLKKHQKTRKNNIIFWEKHLPEILSFIDSYRQSSNLIRLPVLARSKKERDVLCSRSERHGLGVMATYPTPINEIPEIAGEFSGRKFPNAQKLADCLMTLPVHEYMTEKDRLKILHLCNRTAIPSRV